MATGDMQALHTHMKEHLKPYEAAANEEKEQVKGRKKQEAATGSIPKNEWMQMWEESVWQI